MASTWAFESFNKENVPSSRAQTCISLCRRHHLFFGIHSCREFHNKGILTFFKKCRSHSNLIESPYLLESSYVLTLSLYLKKKEFMILFLSQHYFLWLFKQYILVNTHIYLYTPIFFKQWELYFTTCAFARECACWLGFESVTLFAGKITV